MSSAAMSPAAKAAASPAPSAQVSKVSPKAVATFESAAGGESEVPCPACGTMISSDAIMCYACGHRLHEESAVEETPDAESESEVACPACGTMISSDAIMCYACGHRLGTEEEKGVKKAPVSVKKVLKKKVI